MAQCKYCHQAITRVDKEVCPFCGGLHPLDGTDTSTQDITKVIDQVEKPIEIKHRKKLVASLLAFIFGFLGAHFFYLGRVKKGFITLVISLVLIGGIGSLIFFVGHWSSVLAFLIPYFVVEAFMIATGIGLLIRHDIVDSNGEFLE